MQILHLCLVGFVKDCSYNEQSEVYVFETEFCASKRHHYYAKKTIDQKIQRKQLTEKTGKEFVRKQRHNLPKLNKDFRK